MAYKGKNVPKGWADRNDSIVIVETRENENDEWKTHAIFRPSNWGMRDGRAIANVSRRLARRDNLEYRYRCGHLAYDDIADKCVIFKP